MSVTGYLESVVPMEMPPSWSAAALQAQAIAARTYAEHAMAFPHASWFDIYGDTRDQVYGGVGAEYAAQHAAVTATAQPGPRDGGRRSRSSPSSAPPTAAGPVPAARATCRRSGIRTTD